MSLRRYNPRDMAEPQQPRKSALRGIGGWIFLAAVFLVLGVAPESFWLTDYWRNDVVAATFRWFFTTLKFYPALGILAYVIYVVERRVKQGDPIRDDINLIGSVVTIIGTVFFLLPSKLRDDFYNWLLSLLYRCTDVRATAPA
jgi:hypothetical protein